MTALRARATATAPLYMAALLAAIGDTVLGSTGQILLKYTLRTEDPLLFSGLRRIFTVPVLLAMPVLWKQRSALRRLSRRTWLLVIALGATIALTELAHIFSLSLLPSTTVGLGVGLVPLIITVLGALLLAERPTLLQAGGMALAIAGTVLFLGQQGAGLNLTGGLLLSGLLLVAALAVIVTRYLRREDAIANSLLTILTQGVASVLVMAVGLPVVASRSVALPGPTVLAVTAWMAISTLLSWTLFNYSLKILLAFEVALINNTVPIQIALLSWWLLGEQISRPMAVGMVIVVLGVLLVQLAHGGQPGQSDEVASAPC